MTGELDVAGLAEVLFAHTGETCDDRDCGDGFGYHDLDSTQERRSGCRHLAAVMLAAMGPTLDRLAAAESAAERVRALADDPDWPIEVALGGCDYVNQQIRAALDQGDGSAS